MNLIELILCIFTLLIWSTSSSLVYQFTSSSNININISYFIIISISLIIFSLLSLNKENIEILKKISKIDFIKLGITGFLALFIYPKLYFSGIAGANVLKANILNYFWPIFAFFISFWVNKKKAKKIEILSMVLAFLGAYFVMLVHEKGYNINSFYNKYAVLSFIGAFVYGLYTAIINWSLPNINTGNGTKIQIDPMLRMFIMILIVYIINIPFALKDIIFNYNYTLNSIYNIINKKEILFPLLWYSIVNFSFAHFIWNKLNAVENITKTASLAFLTPLLSTLILAYQSKAEYNLNFVIGLLFIEISIIINYREKINSINFTIIGAILHFIILQILPLNSKNNIWNDNAKFFLEVIVTLFSIYYGFVMSRVTSEYKEFVSLIDKIVVYKKNHSIDNKAFNEIEEYILSTRSLTNIDYEVSPIIFYDKLPKNLNREDIITISNFYFPLLRKRNHALFINEWLILGLLSLFIVFLCFYIRDGQFITDFITCLVFSALSLCLLSLYDYECKKTKLIKELLLVQ